jgi:energy-coupling factor transporter transmembrane protein EcfT
MKFDFLKSISPLEIFLFIIFVIYIIFPINTPELLIPIINSCIGMVVIFIATIYLLFYTTPFLAILAIFAAYELIRRSGGKINKINSYNVNLKDYNPPTQEEKDDKMLELNPVKIETLEEEVVYKMAPIGKSDTSTYIETSYKPIADPLFCGSMCN